MSCTQERNLLVTVFFIVRSYINAETKKYQFNYRKYTNSCNYQRQLITQSLRKPTSFKVICVGNFRLANSITTNKSQSMTAHNGIVYEP